MEIFPICSMCFYGSLDVIVLFFRLSAIYYRSMCTLKLRRALRLHSSA